MAILIQDDFNRADNAASVGSPSAGGPYTVRSGTWGVNNQELYLSTPATNAQITFPAAANLDISMKFAIANNTNVVPALMWRWSDTSNFWCTSRTSTGFSAIFRCSAGTYTQVSEPFSSAVADVFRVVAYETQMAWYLNGKQMGVMPDPWYSPAISAAGFRNGGSSSGRWDNLFAQDQTTPINTWGAAELSAPAMPDVVGSTATLVPSLYKGRTTALADESEIP